MSVALLPLVLVPVGLVLAFLLSPRQSHARAALPVPAHSSSASSASHTSPDPPSLSSLSALVRAWQWPSSGFVVDSPRWSALQQQSRRSSCSAFSPCPHSPAAVLCPFHVLSEPGCERVVGAMVVLHLPARASMVRPPSALVASARLPPSPSEPAAGLRCVLPLLLLPLSPRLLRRPREAAAESHEGAAAAGGHRRAAAADVHQTKGTDQPRGSQGAVEDQGKQVHGQEGAGGREGQRRGEGGGGCCPSRWRAEQLRASAADGRGRLQLCSLAQLTDCTAQPRRRRRRRGGG